LAGSHYENFLVASIFLPSHLRQHYYNIYAYCRISDDLGDETSNPALSLELLSRWEEELQSCFDGHPRHPVFIALRETVEQFQIPMTPFSNLLEAFKRDQTKNRYLTYDELLDYCRYSANPVGHLVLYLIGYRDAERRELSDKTCTALQLTNHWQDIGRDLVRLNRVYIPLEDMLHFGYTEADLIAQTSDDRFAALMRLEIERARSLFHQGQKLRDLVRPSQAMDIELFSRCGLEVLRQIELARYDVFRRRPTLTKWNSLKILTQSWWSNQLRK
jgi:squalene synthase HpnC